MDSQSKILPAGKLPPDLLAAVLSNVSRNDPRVVIGPRVGTDAAAIDMGESVLILKSDPITFATEDAGWYLVNVNANDIVCMGGTPKWLLVTALLPELGTTPALVSRLFDSLNRACDDLDITLIGGHTEITIGLDRPILVGAMLGEAHRDELIDPSNAEDGDAILLCKGIAIEGTALLAREAADALADVGPTILNRAVAFLEDPGISVVSAAKHLRQSGARVHALHDPTEGGLATAIRELATATNMHAEIDLDLVTTYPETTAICQALNLDPLGLIASGALLAVVRNEDCATAITHLEASGVPCVCIGHLRKGDAGVVATRGSVPAVLPEFDVDEIARYFAS